MEFKDMFLKVSITEINQISLNEFADLLPDKARMERDQIISGLKTWDKSVRNNLGKAMKRIYNS